MGELEGELDASKIAVEKPPPNNKFSVEVEINGKKMRFSGKIPQGFVDSATLQSWYLLPLDEKAEKASTKDLSQLGRNQQRWYAYGCPLGELHFSGPTGIDDPESLMILGVSSHSGNFPSQSSYKSVRGIGNFFIKEICELANLQKRTLYLVPGDLLPPKENDMTDAQLKQWYGKNGFVDAGDNIRRIMKRDPQLPSGDRYISKAYNLQQEKYNKTIG